MFYKQSCEHNKFAIPFAFQLQFSTVTLIKEVPAFLNLATTGNASAQHWLQMTNVR